MKINITILISSLIRIHNGDGLNILVVEDRIIFDTDK
jgi:hypothetical protein